MAIYERSIVVNVPADVVYNQWMRLEEFPMFMEFVQEVRRLDDDRFYWRMQIGGVIKEWEGLINRRIPNQELHWRSISKTRIAGGVTLRSLDSWTTHVTLRLDYTPESFIESLGESLGMVAVVLEGDLKQFKAFIEASGGLAARAVGDPPSAEREL